MYVFVLNVCIAFNDFYFSDYAHSVIGSSDSRIGM
jgi:hypothetical protein